MLCLRLMADKIPTHPFNNNKKKMQVAKIKSYKFIIKKIKNGVNLQRVTAKNMLIHTSFIELNKNVFSLLVVVRLKNLCGRAKTECKNDQTFFFF